ncbi:hypothetical protein [Crocosphaera chwakensis]|uniref:Uncharacterized protein n=1 Tax=Crocosphaera chwakensis CCY0110 TaxID=391612 RepID=A3ING0_9CHRO|nr:hypothetical protein [Crocosphaera chwakensis]EAZ91858.1 hypothetical protein CY0110_29324 [Crocosphaera chwakensis CCY0110]
MHIIAGKPSNKFVAKYPESKTSLLQWYQIIRSNNFSSLDLSSCLTSLSNHFVSKLIRGLILLNPAKIVYIKEID